MTIKIFRSRWFWIFLLICIIEEATFFFPFLSLFLLAAAVFPNTAKRYAHIFIEYYNDVYGTSFQIVEAGSENNGRDVSS